jgi:hypothetical protein
VRFVRPSLVFGKTYCVTESLSVSLCVFVRRFSTAYYAGSLLCLVTCGISAIRCFAASLARTRGITQWLQSRASGNCCRDELQH